MVAINVFCVCRSCFEYGIDKTSLFLFFSRITMKLLLDCENYQMSVIRIYFGMLRCVHCFV